MTDYFADPAGDNANAGTIDLPKRTLNGLLDVMAPGDRGFLREGVYPTSVITNYNIDLTATRSGTLADPKKILSFPGETATIRGRNIIRDDGGHVHFERINFEQHPANPFTLIEQYGDNVRYDQCDFTNGDQAAIGILVGSNASGWVVTLAQFTRCSFHDIGPAGSNLYHPIYFDKIDAAELGDVLVKNCLFYNNQGGYSIQFYRDARRALVENCTMYNHERGIIFSGADATNYTRDTVVRRTIVHTTNGASDAWGATHFWSGGGVGTGNELLNNIFWNMAVGFTADGGIRQDGDGQDGYTVTDHQYIDPLFVDAGAGDFNTQEPLAEGIGVNAPEQIGPNGIDPETDVGPPAVVVGPVITGQAQEGGTLSVNTGFWTHEPEIFSYQWKADGVAIAGATTNELNLTDDDRGKAISCIVTATNVFGSGFTETDLVGVFDPEAVPYPFIPGELTLLVYEEVVKANRGQAADEEQGWPLLAWVEGFCRSLQEVYDVVKERDDRPGYAVLLDADLAPANALGYLAQFIGLRLVNNAPEADNRLEIKEGSNLKRGSIPAIIFEAQKYLTGSKQVYFLERAGSAYTFGLSTLASETPDPTLLEQRVKARQKPIGLIMQYTTIVGGDWATVAGTHATWNEVLVDFTDWQDVQDDPSQT